MVIEGVPHPPGWTGGSRPLLMLDQGGLGYQEVAGTRGRTASRGRDQPAFAVMRVGSLSVASRARFHLIGRVQSSGPKSAADLE